MHPLMLRQKTLINQFFDSVDPSMMDLALEAILKCKGNVLFTGVGKSGLAAELLAMMLTSVGTKAFYLSPMNALHGDLGMISEVDLVIMLSKSGNTEELYQLGLLLQERSISIMGWFCQTKGKLSKICTSLIHLPLDKELCPFDLSPTTSTIVQLAFGNTVAVALMEKKEFSKEEYQLNHPSGTIGKKIRLKVQDIMLQNADIPKCHVKQSIQDILVELSDKRCGCILVLDDEKNLKGIFTDGDLRRAIKQDQQKVFATNVEHYMTQEFLSISPDRTLMEALKIMQDDMSLKKISALPVTSDNQLIGLIRLHDIISLGLN